MVMRAGLTGGIGSGKSTVAGILRSLGVPVIDTDAIAHQLTQEPYGKALAQIKSTFGQAVLEPNGSFSRRHLRDLVFSSPSHKHLLEAILHPLIREETKQQFEQCAQHYDIVVFDIPLLAESHSWQNQLDRILVIDSTESTQIERVIARSGWPREQVESVIAQQATRQERLAIATDVIVNEHISLDELHNQVERLLNHWHHELHSL